MGRQRHGIQSPRVMGTVFLGLLFSLAFACKGGERGKADAASAVAGKASPVQFKVINDTKTDQELELTFGAHQPFGLSLRTGPEAGPKGLAGCWCKCHMDACPDAARPRTQKVVLKPGESHSFSWTGQIQVGGTNRHGQWCCKDVDPPVGDYVATACTTAGWCAHQAIQLPSKGSVEIRLSNRSKADRCEDLDLSTLKKMAKRAAAQLEGPGLQGDPAGCPGPVTCVLAAKLEGARKKGQEGGCATFVVPRGDELELQFSMLPRKSGQPRVLRSTFYDPQLSRIFRVQ